MGLQNIATGIGMSNGRSTMYALAMDSLLIPMANFPVKPLEFDWTMMRPFMSLAPTPAGGHVGVAPMQLQMPIMPITPPVWQARTNGELQGRSKKPTARQSVCLPARLGLAALRPPAQQ